jgi:hypothetical protein
MNGARACFKSLTDAVPDTCTAEMQLFAMERAESIRAAPGVEPAV